MKERYLLKIYTYGLSPYGKNLYKVISANYRYAKYPRKCFCIKVQTIDSQRIINILDYEVNAEQIEILRNLLKSSDNEAIFIELSDLKAMSYRFNNGKSSGIALYATTFNVIEQQNPKEETP